jgi:hypothetical protein
LSTRFWIKGLKSGCKNTCRKTSDNSSCTLLYLFKLISIISRAAIPNSRCILECGSYKCWIEFRSRCFLLIFNLSFFNNPNFYKLSPLWNQYKWVNWDCVTEVNLNDDEMGHILVCHLEKNNFGNKGLPFLEKQTTLVLDGLNLRSHLFDQDSKICKSWLSLYSISNILYDDCWRELSSAKCLHIDSMLAATSFTWILKKERP